jgi:hypothetical protein
MGKESNQIRVTRPAVRSCEGGSRRSRAWKPTGKVKEGVMVQARWQLGAIEAVDHYCRSPYTLRRGGGGQELNLDDPGKFDVTWVTECGYRGNSGGAAQEVPLHKHLPGPLNLVPHRFRCRDFSSSQEPRDQSTASLLIVLVLPVGSPISIFSFST